MKSDSKYEFKPGEETQTTKSAVVANPKSFKVKISGTPQIGQTLTVSTEPSDVTIKGIQWQTVGDTQGAYNNIEGATAATFVPTINENGKQIVVTIKSDNIKYEEGPIRSEPTEPVQKKKFEVKLEGSAIVNKELTAVVTPSSLTGLKYEWKKNKEGENPTIITNNDQSKLKLTSTEATYTITVSVTTTDADYVDSVTSDPSPVVVSEGEKVTFIVTIKGTKKVGQTIQVETNPTSIQSTKTTYAWYSKEKTAEGDFTKIDQSESSFKLPKTLENHLIKAGVTIEGNTDYTDKEVLSAEFGPIDGLPKISKVEIDGEPKVGQTLTAKLYDTAEPSQLLNIPKGQVKYEWSEIGDNNKATTIQQGDQSTLSLQPNNAGKSIKVTVKGDGINYDDSEIPSGNTEKVVALEIICTNPSTIVPGIPNCCTSDEQCEACSTTELTKCKTCKDGYEVNDKGICEEKSEGASSDSGSAEGDSSDSGSAEGASSDSGSAEGASSDSGSDEGASSDSGSLEPPSTECTLIGCSKCVDGDTSKCEQCYTNNGFVLQSGSCVCNTASGFGFAKEPEDDASAPGGKKCKCADPTQTNKDGKCVSNQQPEKGCKVSNCKICRDDDNTYCDECDDGYGLRGGYCTKCKEGLYSNSRTPCQYDCSQITNCEEFGDTSTNVPYGNCDVENGELYCYRCIDGYPSPDFKSCIPYPQYKCSDIPGCLECEEKDGELICKTCDTANHFVPEHGFCGCDQANNYHFDTNDMKCHLVVDCAKDSHCTTCFDSETNCVKCENNYELSGGKCTQCKEGFDLFYGKCINVTLVPCPNIEGCESCYAGDLTRCIFCNKTANYRKSRRDMHKCVCNENYDYVNKQCVRPNPPYVQPTPNPDDIVDLGDKIDSQDGNYTVKGVIEEKGKFNGYTFKSTDKSVNVEAKYKNDPFYFTIETGRTTPFEVKVPKDASNVTLDCSTTSIAIPPENQIILYGSGIITVDSSDTSDAKEKTVSIGRVMIKPGENLELKSNNANITLNELDISGDHEFSGQTDGMTKCTKLLVEEGSLFTPSYITFENIVRIGKQAQLTLNKESNVQIKGIPFELYYGQRNYGNQETPLKFNSNSKDGFLEFLEGCSAKIMHIEDSAPLPKEENENFTVAEFASGDEKTNEEACANFKFEDSENFKNAVCEKDENGVYRKVATKNIKSDDDGGKKKKKLSGGAIAGIVIACIVVVAAIIALLVYFLVIKKKNASTTSTQGDSSIAI